jgi:hypothetical protein
MGRATGFLGSDGNGLRPADDQPACNPRRRRSAAVVAKQKIGRATALLRIDQASRLT